MFIGREKEIKKLRELLEKKTASLVVVKGRRRIGKSFLIAKFGESFDRFYAFQGLAPRPGMTEQDQLKNFGEQVGEAFAIPISSFENWTKALSHLAGLTRRGSVLVLIDEVSWMANNQPDFAGKLKIAWDTHFKNNPRLVLVLCGSVSSWIDQNILADGDFVGRVSLEIDLQEMPLSDCDLFWGKKGRFVSTRDKLKILCAVGGVPKYLEEINPSESAEQNLQRLFFRQGAPLLKEFDKIFNEIFNKRSGKYREIVRLLCAKKMSALELARKLRRDQNGTITEYLSDLEASGFIKRDYVWKHDGKKSRISKYRIKDNYLRFYLKYVEPVQEKISAGLFELVACERMEGWSSFLGFQFENLVLNNLSQVIQVIGIDPNSIVSAAPYFQNKTGKQKGCQVDLLIATRFHTLYVCEIKFRNRLSVEIITDMQKKIHALKRPKFTSLRPVLIYEGELSDDVKESCFFDKLVCVGDFMKANDD